MSQADKVRFSRDGDQFHYNWAARRCLRLLSPSTPLTAVTIEGPSAQEGEGVAEVDAGAAVIDVAEYYGSQRFAEANRVEYLQLKHSTVQTDSPWTASGLARTLRGFGARYQAFRQTHGVAVTDTRLRFQFLSNRLIADNVQDSVEDLARGETPRHPGVAAELLRHAALPSGLVRPFFSRLTLNGQEPRFTDQADLLASETIALMAGIDLDAALRLVNLVTLKATSGGQKNPAITRPDVLQALRIGEDRLLPASSRLEPDPNAVPRLQEAEIGAQIVAADQPVVIRASGGVGKSVLSTRLGAFMPPGSVTVVYDCYGNGEYRQLAHARHPHRIALVQIANELAFRGLCFPLLPTSAADSQDYMRNFLGRLAEAVTAVRSATPGALVTLVIDAADNAQMAAEDAGAAPAFARDLLRQPLPEGARLVMLYRPEREDKLAPPPQALRISLDPFTPDESASMLARRYPTATPLEAAEFHRLSSANPRVQANALTAEPDLPSLLRSLGPNPTTVDDMIAGQLKKALEIVRDEAGADGAGIDTLCAALATLRPLIPLRVLSAVSGLSVDAIRSFASDFGGGRPLLITADAIQFRDEPVEDWFRKTYRGTEVQLRSFVERLQPLADSDGYVAANLPALMLACGHLDELVALALSTARLPVDSPLERREIELARLQFALKASLRARRWLDASKLAMKAGEEAAGAARHEALLRDNPDLVGALFEPERLQDLASRDIFGGHWLGERYASEAALMCSAPDLHGEALGKLRMVDVWLTAWSRDSGTSEDRVEITDDHRCDLAFAQLRLRGPEVACAELLRWSPDKIWFETGLKLAARLVDHGLFEDLEALAAAATARKAAPLLAAIAIALSAVNRALPLAAVEAVFAARPTRARRHLERGDPWIKAPDRSAVLALVEAALRHGATDHVGLARRLTRALPKNPPDNLEDRWNEQRSELMQAYGLRAALLGRDFTLEDVASPKMLTRLRAKGTMSGSSQEYDEFCARVGALLPWWRLHGRSLVAAARQQPLDLAADLEAARNASTGAFPSYNEDRYEAHDEIAMVWFDLLCTAGPPGADHLAPFENWVGSLKRPLYVRTWTALARKAARTPHLHGAAHRFAQRALSNEWTPDGEHADTRIEVYVGAARAIFSLDRAEAGAYLGQAVEIASKLGDEVYVRWQAILALANRGAESDRPDPALGHRLARAAEFCAEYVDRHFEWHATIKALPGFGPAAAVATVSRWRDREVTWFSDALKALVQALPAHGGLDPVLALSLTGFRFGWSTEELLARALAAEDDPRQRAEYLLTTVRYAALEPFSVEAWEKVLDLAQQDGHPTAEVERRLAQARERARREPQSTPTYPGKRPRPIDWTRALRDKPVETVAGALAARDGARGVNFVANGFWGAVFARVTVGQEAAFVGELLASPSLDLYQLKEFCDAIPQAWNDRAAVKAALRTGMAGVARRNCWRIRLNRRMTSFPLDAMVKTSGATEDNLLDEVLSGVADDPDPAGAEDLFNLVPLLSRRLDLDQARDSLGYGLALIEASLDPEVGDGPWRDALAVPEDVDLALAGLIWGTLGAIDETVRWQAAHVVRMLVRFRRARVMHALVSHLTHGAGAFASPNLIFYELHAQMWLILALARAALESPQAVAPYADTLRPFAHRSFPHVMIRRYAAQALVALDDAGAVSLDSADRSALEKINEPGQPLEVFESYGDGGGFDRYGPSRPEPKFIFDYDVSRNLMEGLCRAFRIQLPDLQEVAEGIIWTDWGLTENGYWNTDPRRGLTSMSQRGSRRGSPVDSLSEYLSYHATFAAAGKLLETHRVKKYGSERRNEFETWLGYQTLTRDDGGWVADRRDPIPTLDPIPADIPAELWRWSLGVPDFDRVLGLSGPRLTISGTWIQPYLYEKHEDVTITSALVSPETARSLLAAAQTARDAWDYVFPPEARTDEPMDEPPYVLQPWVARDHLERHLDKRDPWGAGMNYPPPTPARTVRSRLDLTSSDDGRRWRRVGAASDLFVSEAWATYRPDDDGGHSRATEGERLTITRRSLPATLRRLGLDLILEVQMSREIHRSSYGHSRDDDIVEYPRPYFRIYLFRQDGSVETLS